MGPQMASEPDFFLLLEIRKYQISRARIIFVGIDERSDSSLEKERKPDSRLTTASAACARR
jgi:hypothetical protein